jgi:hypothetical protein
MLAVVIAILLLTMPVFSSSTNSIILSEGVIQYASIYGFQLRGAGVAINCFHPQARNYQPNAWSIIKDLGINVIRVWGGVEGDIWHLNIKEQSNEWAQNLDAFLTEADSNGVKVIFHQMGDDWGTLFGITPPPQGGGPYPPVSIDEAKAMIDKLAGNNVLGHDFINDPRILGWRPSNERDITDPYVLQWSLEICDYIRSKGAKAWLASPRGQGGWWIGEDFHVTEPILREHVDYLERHLYEIWDFNNLGKTYNDFYNYYTSVLQDHMINGRGIFPVENLILGEFGIWRGYGEDCGYSGSFTDEERQTYYRAILDACKNVGIKNILFHDLFAQKIGPSWTEYETPNYGIVDVDGSYFPLVSNVIKSAY